MSKKKDLPVGFGCPWYGKSVVSGEKVVKSLVVRSVGKIADN